MTEQSLEERKLAVIEQINKAFDGVSRGEGITLHQGNVIDDCGTEKEQRKARKLDKEKRWQDVKNEDIISLGQFAITFLDAEGYRYYLPAFMVWSLRNLEGAQNRSMMHDVLVWSLGNSFPKKRYFSLCQYRDEFNQAQKRAIAAFLSFLMNDHPEEDGDDARECYERYWGQFLEGD